MTLPRWNREWEKPDPLRGRRGWARHHYVAAGVAAALFATVFGLEVPAVARARQKAAELNRTYEQLQEATAVGISGTLR